MDNRELSILESDQCKMLVLTIPGIGGEVTAHYGPVTDSPKEMGEAVRRYNAYPELVGFLQMIVNGGLLAEEAGVIEAEANAILIKFNTLDQ